MEKIFFFFLFTCSSNTASFGNSILTIVSALAAVGAVVVAILNWIQIENSLKARLIFSIKSINRALYLEVKNVGQRVAENICFEMNDAFMNCIIGGLKQQYEGVKVRPFKLCGGDKYNFFILPLNSPCSIEKTSPEEIKKLREEFYGIEIVITVKYRRRAFGYYKNVKVLERFKSIEYMPSSVDIPDPILKILEKIEKKIKE
jgi:hypothetical protein